MNSIVSVLHVLSWLIIILLCGKLEGNIGAIVLFIGMFELIRGYVINIVNHMKEFVSYRTEAKRMDELLGNTPPTETIESVFTYDKILSWKNVRIAYDNHAIIIDLMVQSATEREWRLSVITEAERQVS